MALARNPSPVASALPSSFASNAGRHRHSPTVLSLPIPAPFEQTQRRFLTWAFGGSVASEPKTLKKLPLKRREVSCNAEVASGQNGGEEREAAAAAVPDFDMSRLEAYTDRFRREVLRVNALLEDEEEDQVIVFKGFSSSLTRGTPDDPSEPVLPSTAVIQSIDRMGAPFNPSEPQCIEQGLSWQEFHQLLEEKGL